MERDKIIVRRHFLQEEKERLERREFQGLISLIHKLKSAALIFQIAYEKHTH